MLLLNYNLPVNDASVYKFECILHRLLTPPSSKSPVCKCPDGLATSKRSWLRLCDNIDSSDYEYWQHNMRHLGRDSER